MNLLLLYLEFFQMGVFAVGGGMAILPFLQLLANDRSVFIQKTGWLTTEQVGSFLAVAQCSPGPVGVNIAVQTGFLYGSISGGIIAALGLITPAVITITIIAKVLQSVKENKTYAAVFSGLRPAAAGLLSAVGWGVWRLALVNLDGVMWHEIIRWRESLICLALFLVILKLKIHPILFIALGAVAGIVLKL